MTGEVEVREGEGAVGQPVTTAGFLRRLLAALVDALVVGWPVGGIVVLLDLVHRPIAREPLQVFALLWAAMVAYSVLMLGHFGWTVGMRALKVRVARADGSPINYRTAALRTFAYALPQVGGAALGEAGQGSAAAVVQAATAIGLLWMIVDPHHQAYHDKIAGTFVVRRPKRVAGQADAVVTAPRVITTASSGVPLRAGKWAVFLILSLLFLSPLGAEVAAFRAGRQINAILAQLKAEGKPLTAAALVPPPIPDADNGALLYQEAERSIQWGNPEWLVCEEATFNWLNLRSLGHGIAPEKLAELKPPPTGDSLDAQVFAVVKRTMAQNADAFALLHKAATMGKWRFPRKDRGWVLNVRRSARELQIEAMLLYEQGDADGALRAAITAVCLLNSLDEPRLVVARFRMISSSIGVGTVERVLFDSTPSPGACRAAEAALAKDELRTSFLRGLEGGRASAVEEFEKVRWSPNPAKEWADHFLPLARIQWRRFLPGGFVRWLVAADELHYLRYMDLCIEQMEFPIFGQDPQVLARLKKLEVVAPDWGTFNQVRYRLPSYMRMFFEVDLWWHELVGQVRHPLSYMFVRLTYTNRRVGEEETGVALARVALLLKVYRAERDSYPESLNDLEGYLGKQVPLDPCSGKAFRYQREGSGFTLYSVGLDGVDDGGARPEKAGPIPILGSLAGGGKDIVWVCKE